jgi:hypothetical protein
MNYIEVNTPEIVRDNYHKIYKVNRKNSRTDIIVHKKREASRILIVTSDRKVIGDFSYFPFTSEFSNVHKYKLIV